MTSRFHTLLSNFKLRRYTMLHAHFATSGGTLRTAYYGDEELRAGVYPGHEEPLVWRCRLTLSNPR